MAALNMANVPPRYAPSIVGHCKASVANFVDKSKQCHQGNGLARHRPSRRRGLVTLGPKRDIDDRTVSDQVACNALSELVRVVTSPRRVSAADDARENGPSWRYAEGRRLDPASGYFDVAMKTPSQSVPGGSRS